MKMTRCTDRGSCSTRYAVRMERAGGLRFGDFLWKALAELRRHDMQPKSFSVARANRGTVVLEWRFAREDEAQAFAATMAATAAALPGVQQTAPRGAPPSSGCETPADPVDGVLDGPEHLCLAGEGAEPCFEKPGIMSVDMSLVSESDEHGHEPPAGENESAVRIHRSGVDADRDGRNVRRRCLDHLTCAFQSRK